MPASAGHWEDKITWDRPGTGHHRIGRFEFFPLGGSQGWWEKSCFHVSIHIQFTSLPFLQPAVIFYAFIYLFEKSSLSTYYMEGTDIAVNGRDQSPPDPTPGRFFLAELIFELFCIYLKGCHHPEIILGVSLNGNPGPSYLFRVLDLLYWSKPSWCDILLCPQDPLIPFTLLALYFLALQA